MNDRELDRIVETSLPKHGVELCFWADVTSRQYDCGAIGTQRIVPFKSQPNDYLVTCDYCNKHYDSREFKNIGPACKPWTRQMRVFVVNEKEAFRLHRDKLRGKSVWRPHNYPYIIRE